jgi:hypothetical protein
MAAFCGRGETMQCRKKHNKMKKKRMIRIKDVEMYKESMIMKSSEKIRW